MALAQTSGQTSGKHHAAYHSIWFTSRKSIAGCHKQGLQSFVWFRLQRQACWPAGNYKLLGPRCLKKSKARKLQVALYWNSELSRGHLAVSVGLLRWPTVRSWPTPAGSIPEDKRSKLTWYWRDMQKIIPLRASLSGTFLETMPELVVPLKGTLYFCTAVYWHCQHSLKD